MMDKETALRYRQIIAESRKVDEYVTRGDYHSALYHAETIQQILLTLVLQDEQAAMRHEREISENVISIYD